MNSRQTTIYSLIDPRDGAIHYIGKTVREPKDRLADHLYRCDHTPRSCWIQELKQLDLHPVCHTLEVVHEDDDWQERERWWISWGKICKWPLTNIKDGGEGGLPGHVVSEETRRKISTKNKGRIKSEKTLRRMSKAQKGKTLSPEARKNMYQASAHGEASHKSKLVGRDVKEIRELYRQGTDSLSALANKYGVHISTIQRAATGETWKHISSKTQGRLDGRPRRNPSPEMRRRMGEPHVGTKSPGAKLTEEIVECVRQVHAKGNITYTALANEYGIDKSTMRSAIIGETWKHIDMVV